MARLIEEIECLHPPMARFIALLYVQNLYQIQTNEVEFQYDHIVLKSASKKVR